MYLRSLHGRGGMVPPGWPHGDASSPCGQLWSGWKTRRRSSERYMAGRRPRLLPRAGMPHPPPLLVVRRSSKPPWPTYSTSWATPAVGSSSWTPSARAVTNLSVPIEELGASRQAEQPAACRRAGILRVSGSGRMPCVPCVLPRPGTLCSMLACVSAGVVCHCLCVSSDGVFAVPVVCDRKRADAAVR